MAVHLYTANRVTSDVDAEFGGRGYRSGYRPEEAPDGWRRMLDWFRKHGV